MLELAFSEPETVLFILGGTFLASAVYLRILFLKDQKMRQNGENTLATVKEITRDWSYYRPPYNRRIMTYFVLYEYVVDGVKYESKRNAGVNPPKNEVGDTIEVYYYPENPSKTTILREGEVTMVLFQVFLVLGILLFMIGFTILLI